MSGYHVINLLMFIIGCGRDKSAPTGGRMNLLISIIEGLLFLVYMRWQNSVLLSVYQQAKADQYSYKDVYHKAVKEREALII